MTTLINHSITGRSCPSSDTEDELLLSPGKQDSHVRTNYSKRSASPSPADEYSPLSGSPSDNRKPKRVKRDSEMEDSQGDRANLKNSDLLQQPSTLGHARNHSDSDVLRGKRSSRKRSATTTTKKAVSTVSVSPTPSAFSPTEKGRAQSVPLFASFNHIPRIDFRNPPPSPKRSRSRSPSKDRELKFRITSTSFSKLGAIPDEPASAMEVVGESGSTLEATDTLLLSKMTEETQPTASINETSALDPPTSFNSTIQIPFSEIPSTPLAKQSLNKLIPLSPLTPLPETPFPAGLSSDVDSRSVGDTGWGVPFPTDVCASERTTKSLLGIVASTSRSRLPRPSMAPASTSNIKSSSTDSFALPPSSSFASNKINAGTAKKEDVPKQNAFTLLMKKPMEAKQRMKEKADREQTEKALRQVLKAGPSTSRQPLRPEKQRLTAKERMRGKPKGKPQKTVLFVPDEDEEDSHNDAELIAPTEGRNRFVASSNSPELYSSTQKVTASLSRDTDMASLSEVEVKGGDTTMSERRAFDDRLVPPIGDIETTTVVPSETVAETAPLQPTPTSLLVGSDIEATAVVPNEKAAKTALLQPPTPPLLEENASITNGPAMLVPSESETLRPTVARSKLPQGKRRQPASAPIVDRVTRSVSLKQKGKTYMLLQPASAAKEQPGRVPVPAKRTAAGSIKGPVPVQEELYVEETSLPPGSPMQLCSPAKSTESTPQDMVMAERTMQTGPGQPVKPISSPSPTKLARTMSRFSVNTVDGLARSFSMDINNQRTGAGSSLSTLSNALEKLRMPPPSRPNTSMGFNRDEHDDDDTFGIPTRSKDDATVKRVSLGLGRSETGLKRAATFGASSFKSPGVSTDVSSSSGMLKKPLVQKSLAIFMGGKAGTAGGSQPATGVHMRSGIKSGLTGKGPAIFGVGGGLRRTVSKKTSLPSVMDSPVKRVQEGGTEEIMEDTIEDADQDAQTPRGSETLVVAPTISNDVPRLDELEIQGSVKGKEKASTFGFNSRRASMVSHALSQSLDSLPPPPQSKSRGLMGPPATPPAGGRSGIRSSSSTYPSSSASGHSPSRTGTSIGTRSSVRIAKTAPGALMKIKGGTGSHVSSGRKGVGGGASTEPNPVPESLKILNDCIIFVDVRTDDGDEAGSLFIDMLAGVGARVLTRVGQTCTHIVFKNGLMSTLTRYRMLRDPKPLVVGIAWVVECVEQRKRVDETKFLVDVEDMQYGTGTSKRRRSMLPRLLPSEMTFSSDTEREDGDADQSMDGSSSSMIIDEVLPPLELARRRKSMLLGPRP